MLAENKMDLEKLNMKIELEKSAGIETKLIDQNEIYNLNNSISSKMINVGYCAEEGKTNPLKATTEIFNYSVYNGLDAYCDDLILDIKNNNGKFTIPTNDREKTSAVVVNFVGSWSNNICIF